MLAFFYSLYISLMQGSWQLLSMSDVNNALTPFINNTASLLVNALGGNFEAIQTFTLMDANVTPIRAIALIMAIISMFGVFFGVLKVTKMVFSIFFGGR